MRYVREPGAITVALKGNNTYQIVRTGNSDVAMDGAEAKIKPCPYANSQP